MKRLTVPQLRLLCQPLKDQCGCCLHVVLDDGNVKDADVEFCVQWAKEKQHPYCELVALCLLTMSKTQRTKLAYP